MTISNSTKRGVLAVFDHYLKNRNISESKSCLVVYQNEIYTVDVGTRSVYESTKEWEEHHAQVHNDRKSVR